jgi:hypothetical protein
MVKSETEVPEPKSGPPVTKRPKPSWYQFIFGFFGGWIILIFFILMLQVELPPSVRITFLAVAFPILIGGTWWVVARGDKYLDEFELGTTREMESMAFRLTVAAIIGFELLVAAGVEWDHDSLNRLFFLSLLWQFAFLKVQRRINRGLKSSIPS